VKLNATAFRFDRNETELKFSRFGQAASGPENAATGREHGNLEGEAKAMQIATNLSNEIARYLDLDTRQIQLTSANMANNAGTDLVGDNGNAGNIFNAPTQVTGSAAAFQVVLTDPSKIAAAGLGLGTGDDTNALATANLATKGIINGLTPSDFYSNLVSTLGASVSETTTQNTALAASVTQLQTQVNSLSGVSLDDEAGNLEEFQRSYQAASQVFTILNSVFASALNLGVETAVA
jgi:flagellar hook-associated protein 1 FlgK